MQFKLVPEAPDSLEFVETAQRAVPLVPGSEDDCCARLMRHTDIAPRDEARTWLTFLRALELAREGPSGFSRVRREPDPAQLRTAFRERVYGADRVLELLEAADGPRSADAVYEQFREEIPNYERHKHGERVDTVWGERVRRLLEWAVVLELAERDGDRYRRA